MHRLLAVIITAFSLAFPALSHSQTTPVWFTLNAQEGQTVTATGSITLRFGQVASTCASKASGACSAGPGAPAPAEWTSPKTFTPAESGTTVSIVIDKESFGNVDPDPGVRKTVQVQEQATAQKITVNKTSVTVPAQSTSSACQLSQTPATITFPNTTDGFQISSSVALTSNCKTTVTIDSVQDPAAPFSISGFQTPFTLAPGKTQSYTAVFSPTATGTATGSIHFASTVSSVQPLTVSLTGTGVSATQGTLASSPTTLSFGNITVNGTSSLTATITNSGSASATISAVSVAGTGFTLTSVKTPITLAVKQSVQLTVNFAPTTSSSAKGTLTITSNASNKSLAVTLTGTGTATGTGTQHSVALSWSDSGTGIAGYNVYRSTVSGGSYSRINSAVVATTSYTDSAVTSGTTYYYVVTATAPSGAESAYSNQISAKVP
ncbi:choice-of-anchor D domain-containing protein [Tunturibacter psychrotolerans]|uniref:Choice-of-anchor D domain-containing protein n=1 Tax=Tunturiibacter psychrotolerans TaxID=3069686 RepID=A0AAU7ZNF8_9BACT